MRIRIALFLLISVARFSVAGPLGVPAFNVGEPVYLSFRYDGGIEGWDGEISATELRGEPCLVTSNGCFLVLTKGRQGFEPAMPDSNNTIQFWQSRTAKHGELVPPIDQRVSGVSYNVALPGPFESVLDITKYYQVDSPGIYTAFWGMSDLWSEEIVFEVLPEGVEFGIRRGESQ